jgi:hypothetical protein
LTADAIKLDHHLGYVFLQSPFAEKESRSLLRI